MRPRTPTFLWVPFVFSIGTVSWALLIASLALISAIVIAPSVRRVNEAEAARNDVQATLELIDKRIAVQNEFIAKATTDVELMQRLASRRLGIEKKGQETLLLNPDELHRDRSVSNLLAESLPEVKVQGVEPPPWYIQPFLHGPTRKFMLMVACGGLVLSFVLGVRFERRG